MSLNGNIDNVKFIDSEGSINDLQKSESVDRLKYLGKMSKL